MNERDKLHLKIVVAAMIFFALGTALITKV